MHCKYYGFLNIYAFDYIYDQIRLLLIELATYLYSKLNAGKRGLQVYSYKL